VLYTKNMFRLYIQKNKLHAFDEFIYILLFEINCKKNIRKKVKSIII